MKGFQDPNKNNLNIKRRNKAYGLNENSNLLNRAKYAQNKGDFVQAAKIYNILLKNNFRTEEFFYNYGLVCQKLKDTNSAILLFKEAIKINPNNFISFFKMGFVLNNKNNFYEAYPFAKKAVDLNPKFWQGYHNLIKILINLNRPNEAINIARNAKNLFSDNYLFSNLLGEIFCSIGNFEEAEKFYKISISLAPNDNEALYSFAYFLMGIGNKKASIKLLHKALDKNPYHSLSYFSLSKMINIEKNQDLKNKIIALKINNFKTNEDRFNILFSKADIYHKLKEFKKSSDFLKQANDLKLIDKPSNIKEVIKLSANVKDKTYLDKSFDKTKFEYLRDIFIVGLPRSGSTLVESIIGMNKEVHNLGENGILRNALVESGKSFFSNMDEIYLKYSQEFSPKKYLTNKMLSNYMYIPHILTKLRHSKVIYTFRNPLDNLLSMYKAKFTGAGNNYSSSLRDSAEYYMYQFRIMCSYCEKYKNHIYFLSYENLVNNPEPEIRKLIDWLGFDWNDFYLHPDKSQQGFFTASNVQVRSPINNKSIGGWKQYSDLMQEPINIFKKNNFKLTSFENLI